MTIEKALKVLQEEAAKGKLDKDLVDLFISQRVYDGGSWQRKMIRAVMTVKFEKLFVQNVI